MSMHGDPATYLQLAREHVRELGDRLELLQPVPHTEVRGAKFYDCFLDRQHWPRYMRDGRAVARTALQRRAQQWQRPAA